MELVVVKGPSPGHRFVLQQGENVVGRSSNAAIHLTSTHVSSRHCVLDVNGLRVVLRDLGSTNGVYLEGRRVAEANVAHGMRLQIGDWLLVLDAPEVHLTDVIEEGQYRPTTPGVRADQSDSGLPPTQEVLRTDERPTTAPEFGRASYPPAQGGSFGGPRPDAGAFGDSRPETGFGASRSEAGAFGGPPSPARPPFDDTLPGHGRPPGLPPNAPADPFPMSRSGFNDEVPVAPEPTGPPMYSPFGDNPFSGASLHDEATVAPRSTDDGYGSSGAFEGSNDDVPLMDDSYPRPVAPAPREAQVESFGAPAGQGGFGFGAPAASQPTPPAPVEPAPGFRAPSGGFGSPRPAFGQSSPDAGGPSAFGSSSAAPTPRSRRDLREVAPSSPLLRVWLRLRRLPWKLQLAGILFLTAAFVMLAPVGGTISQYRRGSGAVEEQAVERGRALGLALASKNAIAMAEQNNLKLDVAFLESQPGVKMAMITDAKGTVRAPGEKVRQSLANKDYFTEATTDNRAIARSAGGGEYHILTPIRVSIVDGAPTSILGWAYILYDAGEVVDTLIPGAVWLIAAMLFLSVGLGGAGLAMWRLVAVPVNGLRDELELALRGHQDEVAPPAEWVQLQDLAHSINRLLDRWRRAADTQASAPAPVPAPSPVLVPAPPPPPPPQYWLPVIQGIVGNLTVPAFVLDASTCVLRASPAAGAWLGCDPASLVGQPISVILPDPIFMDRLASSCARMLGGSESVASEATQVGGNQARLTLIRSASEGILLIVAIG